MIRHLSLKISNCMFSLVVQRKLLVFSFFFFIIFTCSLSFSFTSTLDQFADRILFKFIFCLLLLTKTYMLLLGLLSFSFILLLSYIRVYFWSHILQVRSVCKWFGVIQIHRFLNCMKKLIALHELSRPFSYFIS